MGKKLGLIVNPVAGMGGKLGFKGTDGQEILAKCREMGAIPEAPLRAVEALKKLAPSRDEVEIVTYPGEMGEDEVRQAGLDPVVIGSTVVGSTTGMDTRRAAQDLVKHGVDLVLFAGGDGTARDVYAAVGRDTVALGIPAGVKIHSAVYAINPRRAGEVAAMYLQGRITRTREAEVMDIDEAAFRQGRVSAELYGYLIVPHEQVFVQSMKAGRNEAEEIGSENIAFFVIDNMEPECLYIVGPGTTTRAIKTKIGQGGTLLGVDVVLNKELIANDVNERQLLELIEDRRAYIVVTVIGGQGYIFGRGNQQISSRVIRKVGKENIIIVATRSKMASLGQKPLLVDTGDPETDAILSGYVRVVTGYYEQMLAGVSS